MLTKSAIERAVPKKKDYYLSDYDGLRLRICPSGRKKWVLRWFAGGKEQTQTFGEYPDMSIAEARQERDKRKAQIYNGRPQEDLMTFGQLADMWLKKMSTSDAVETTLYTYKLRIRYLHSLASRPVAELKPD